MPARARFFSLSAIALSISCARQTAPTLEDSRGVVVQWECSAGECQVTGTSDPPPACTALPDIDLFVLGAGSFALLCGASVVGHALVLHDESCRPIRCANETDCPQWDDRRYGCDAGLCTTTTRALDLLDVTAACLADVDRPATCVAAGMDAATQDGLLLAASACTAEGCTLPEACRP